MRIVDNRKADLMDTRSQKEDFSELESVYLAVAENSDLQGGDSIEDIVRATGVAEILHSSQTMTNQEVLFKIDSDLQGSEAGDIKNGIEKLLAAQQPGVKVFPTLRDVEDSIVGYYPDQLVIGFDNLSRVDMGAILARLGFRLESSQNSTAVVNLAGQPLDVALDKLRSEPGVRFAEPNFVVRETDFDGERALVRQGHGLNEPIDMPWNLSLINLDAVDATVTGEGVVVAVVDIRIDFDQPDLKPALLTTSDVLNFGPKMQRPIFDHGTGVAGVIAAQTMMSNGRRLGVAPDTKILPVAIAGSGSYVERAAAVSLLADICAAGAFQEGADHFPIDRLVVNCSWKTGTRIVIIDDAVERLVAAGAVVCFASGNQTTGRAEKPGDLDGCISVTSILRDSTKNADSNWGPGVSCAAPGGVHPAPPDCENDKCIASLALYQGLSYYSGTSFAAPHVAALCALIWSANPGFTAFEVRKALLDNLVDIDALNPSLEGQLGGGRVDAGKLPLKPTATPA